MWSGATVSAMQLLTKAGQLVDELARLGSATPAELAKAIGEPRPSVYRMVEGLESIGVVRSPAPGRLELGTALLRWGDAAVDAFIDRAELNEQLRWVREQLGTNVYFFVPRGEGALCLDHVDGVAVDMLDLAPGRMLSREGGAVMSALTSNPESRYWTVDDNDIVDGVASIAAPVAGADGRVLGVIAVAGLRQSVLAQEAAAGQVLGVAAEAIAGRMGRPRPAAGSVEPECPTARGPGLIVKAGALMEALASEHVATSARLIDLLGESVSSVYRMLSTLVDIGWVEQIGHRGPYRVAGKLLSLASGLTRGLDIRRAALPVMTAIHEATGETTFLCIRHGTRAVCIERIDGIRVNSRVLRLGRSLPLHVGAAPRALLAFEERQAWDDYATLAAVSEDVLHDGGSRSALYAQLEEIRAAGFAVSDNTVTQGIAAVGAPIFDHRGRVAASLSVSGLRDGVLAQPQRGKSVTDLVLGGARMLSTYLGYAEVLPSLMAN